MKNTKGLSVPPERPINGHDVSNDLYSKAAPIETGPKSIDRETTRYLCAATQISIEYAERVVTRVMNEPFRALAPTFGIDVEAVAKWAIQALHTRAQRDEILCTIFALLIPISALSFIWTPTLILLPVIFIAAWLTVSWEHWERMHNVVTQQMLRNRFDPRVAPSPHRENDRVRLEEVAKRRDGNLVVFSGHSAFIGSGQKLYYQRILLDVSRGKESEDGAPMNPDEFTSDDLHAAIIRAFDDKNGLARNLANIRAYERLSVNGLHIQHDHRLSPNQLRAPPTSVDENF